MLKKLFGVNKKETKEILYAPLSGEVKMLSDVPDPVFAEKMMGDGFAIIPTDGVVTSPVNGRILQVLHTKHAIGIRSENGLEILIHVGLETVSLDGKGFEVHVSEGQKVKQNDKLLTFDLEFISKNARSTITPVVITNSNEKLEKIEIEFNKKVEKGLTAVATTLIN
jgi:PTS system glucose-specific IIA component